MKNNSSRNQVKLPFGLRNGVLIHISEVPSGLACGCYCAACKVRLEAKKGTKNAHHFAHYQAEQCEYAIETALHLAAKKVLEQSAQLTLPELTIHEQVYGETCGQSITKSGSASVCEAHVVLIEDVVLEKPLNNIIPDVIATIDGNPLIIEIGVTHFVDQRKENKIHNLKISSIEIDLSGIDRDADLESIRSVVVDSIDHKVWLFHRETEKVRSELRSKLETELQIELEQIYQKEQERQRQENEFHRRKQKKLEMERQSAQPSVCLLERHLKDIKSQRSKYVQSFPWLPIWKRASTNMGISPQTLPDFLNHFVKGEDIFACDRRAWQAGLFSTFIYKKFQKYDNPYPISINRMYQWCQNNVPLNRFALALWSKKEFVEPTVLNKLQNFNLYSAIWEFAKHLEREGFIEHLYDDKCIIIKDRFPVNNSYEHHETSILMKDNEAAFNKLSEDERERFQERAGILEFCGGFTRNEAERLAYGALFNH